MLEIYYVLRVQEIRSSNPPVVTGICDPNKSRAGNPCNIKSLIENKTQYFKNCVKPNNPDSIKHFEQLQDALQKMLKFIRKSIIPRFLKNFQLIKSILNVTDLF